MTNYNTPLVAIVGNGRAGKDTAGAWFGANTLLRYAGSTSNIICPMVAESLGITKEQAWEERHQNRQYWYDWANEYRKTDPARIVKAALEKSDMVIGIRDMREIVALKEQHLVDMIIWIERNVPYDPTVKFTKDDCDVVIENNSTLDEFHNKLRALAIFAGLYAKMDPSHCSDLQAVS